MKYGPVKTVDYNHNKYQVSIFYWLNFIGNVDVHVTGLQENLLSWPLLIII